MNRLGQSQPIVKSTSAEIHRRCYARRQPTKSAAPANTPSAMFTSSGTAPMSMLRSG